MHRQQVYGFRINSGKHGGEIFFVGLLVGAIYAFNEMISQLVLRVLFNSNVSTVWVTYVNLLVLPFVSFMLAPCLVFVTVYAWAKKRLHENFRENYSKLILYLFFGSITGFIFTYFPLIFLAGDTIVVQNFPSFIVGVFQYIQAIISVSVSLILTGFTALAICYFRNEKEGNQNERMTKTYEKTLPQEYPKIS